MIVVLELPTPRIIKKKFKKYKKKYFTKERGIIYALVASGVITIYASDVPVKILPISALIYCAVAYEILDHTNYIIEDPIILNELLNNYSIRNMNLYI
ncbi:MAG: hypothetical protein ACRC57_12305 [Sarcina sp.]